MDSEISKELAYCAKETSVDNIIENIYVGNYAAALDKEVLKLLGITHILVSANNLKEYYPDEYTYKTIPLYDSEYTKIAKYFSESNEFIDLGNKNGKILVHCGAGVSRSVSLVIAYMINNLQYPYSEAIKLVKSKRSVANPNQGFEKQLRDYSYQIHKKF